MKQLKSISRTFTCGGIPEETVVNIISIAMTAAGVKHTLPAYTEISSELLASIPHEISSSFVEEIKTIREIADELVFRHKSVSLNLLSGRGLFKLYFICHD